QRLVEAKRRDGALAIFLVRLRVDQDVDRVADGIDADEHQQRHDQQDDDALEATPYDKNQHVRNRIACPMFPSLRGESSGSARDSPVAGPDESRVSLSSVFFTAASTP